MEELDDVSDSVTENGKSDGDNSDEHEEGEISDDDITIERVVKPLTSEVVIYDEYGRTAIFTSPSKRSNWNMDNYNQYNEERHAESNELPVYSKRHNKNYLEEARCTKTKRSLKDDRKTRKSHRKQKRNRSPSSSSSSGSDCSSCVSCSCCSSSSSRSTSSCCSIEPKKTRGKENKQVNPTDRVKPASAGASRTSSSNRSPTRNISEKSQREKIKQSTSNRLHNSLKPTKSHTGPRKLSQSHSPPHRKEVTRQSPPIYGRMKHSRPSRSPVRSLYSQNRVVQTSVKAVRSRSGMLKDKTVRRNSVKEKEMRNKTSRKGIARLKGRPAEKELIDLTLGDHKTTPPPGSLGEMLLRKTKKGKLKAGRALINSTKKDPIKETVNHCIDEVKIISKKVMPVAAEDDSTLVLKDMVNIDLDQEDEDELQLRLVALQSSLKVLSEVRREGQIAASQGAAAKAKDTNDNSNYMVPDNVDITLYDRRLSQNISPFEDTLLQYIFKKDAAGEFHDMTDKRKKIPISAWDAYVLSNQKKATNQLIKDAWPEFREDVKELSDSNQDLVDMEICDSSPEEDCDAIDEDVLKEVGEDITLDDDILLAKQTEENTGQDGYQHNNFQIPVEWAYMLPPPPPPDQPDNDISNINSWCYDQNMYLQSMQATSCNSSDQVASYDVLGQAHLNWRQNSHTNQSGIECFGNVGEQLENQLGLPNSSIFCHDQSIEHDRDLTSDLLDLPKKSISEVSSNENRNKEDGFQYVCQESLKDQAAHQYQAFMSAMLQNRNSQSQLKTTSLERNLIEVNLKKAATIQPTQSTQQNVKVSGSERNLIKINIVKKSAKPITSLEVMKNNKAAARKRRRSERKAKRKLEKQKAKERMLVQVAGTAEDKNEGQIDMNSASINPDEEDEDLLRAQLLIDLSRKKMQKVEKVTGASYDNSSGFISETIANSNQKSLVIGSASIRLEQSENTPPCSFSSSAESSPKIRPASFALSRRKMLQHRTNVKEGSPTHTFRKDPRHLSDIGGYGLDPKNSRYDFTAPQDLNVRKDLPKFKYPPIKPVIINMDTDSSSEDDDEGMVEEELVQAGCSKTNEPQASSSGSKGSFSSSLDDLLKSMRARSTSIEALPAKPQLMGSKSAADDGQTNTTPNAVRHLSHTKQAEYHWLKEQLRKKESLQRKRQLEQKKITVCKKLKETESVSSMIDKRHVETKYTTDTLKADEKGENISSRKEREVSLQEKGMIQIQLANTVTSEVDHVEKAEEEETDQQNGNRSVEMAEEEETDQQNGNRSESTNEDEDEETLRLMVLQTLQKKKAEKRTHEKVSDDNLTKSEVEPLPTMLKVVIQQNTRESLSSETIPEHNGRKVMTEVQTIKKSNYGGEKPCNKNEWLVMDEVKEEEFDKMDEKCKDKRNEIESSTEEEKEMTSAESGKLDEKGTHTVIPDNKGITRKKSMDKVDKKGAHEDQIDEGINNTQQKINPVIKNVIKSRVLTGVVTSGSLSLIQPKDENLLDGSESVSPKASTENKDTPKVIGNSENNVKLASSSKKKFIQGVKMFHLIK